MELLPLIIPCIAIIIILICYIFYLWGQIHKIQKGVDEAIQNKINPLLDIVKEMFEMLKLGHDYRDQLVSLKSKLKKLEE